MSLVFVDDAVAADFQPFALTRPACELRAGAELVRRRWEIATGEPSLGFIGAPHLDDFEEPGAAPALSGAIPAGSLLVNARCAVSLNRLPEGVRAVRCGGRLAAVRVRVATSADEVRRDPTLASLAGHARQHEADGQWLEQVWDLVRLLPELLAADIPAMGPPGAERPASTAVLGSHPVRIEEGSLVEPFVVVDASAGPVLVRRGATVRSFTRLEGPCLIGEGTIVGGGRVAGSSIGEHCRVHGEVSHSIFIGHANKAHDGFLGHSVLGRWVNLGAGTTNSNLKNNYSDVSLWTPRGVERTGLQFLGAFLGDHAKTAIATRLTTGAVIGAGANVVGRGITPRYIPPFAWGFDESDAWELEPFLETAERAMARRHVALTERGRRQLAVAWRIAVEGPA